jgi:NAD(P) transhydrogenase subunit alpha
VAPATTVLYARNLFNFLQLLVNKDGALQVDTGDELVKGTLLTQGGQIVHDAFKPAA